MYAEHDYTRHWFDFNRNSRPIPCLTLIEIDSTQSLIKIYFWKFWLCKLNWLFCCKNKLWVSCLHFLASEQSPIYFSHSLGKPCSIWAQRNLWTFLYNLMKWFPFQMLTPTMDFMIVEQIWGKYLWINQLGLGPDMGGIQSGFLFSTRLGISVTSILHCWATTDALYLTFCKCHKRTRILLSNSVRGIVNMKCERWAFEEN